MPEFATVLSNAVTGLFALLAAYYAWRLKRASDDRERKTALAVERHKELSDLYAQVFTMLEQAMKHTFALEPFDLTSERSRVNARVRLLCSDAVNEAYDDVADKLQSWSALHIAASPRQMRVGEQTLTIVQAPDPTREYKAPAEAAHKALHEALHVLRSRMRADLSTPSCSIERK
jgi:hypothetical protein